MEHKCVCGKSAFAKITFSGTSKKSGRTYTNEVIILCGEHTQKAIKSEVEDPDCTSFVVEKV